LHHPKQNAPDAEGTTFPAEARIERGKYISIAHLKH